MEKLSKIEMMLKQFTEEYILKHIKHKKLNKELQFVYLSKSKNEIYVYDEDYGIQEIARISYAINEKGVYISDFIVSSEYQNKGLGRILLNLAALHGYESGKTILYGVASPIDSIIDISSEDELSFDKERETLKLIYEKLGCEVKECEDEYHFVLNMKEKPQLNKELELFMSDIIGLRNQEKNQE